MSNNAVHIFASFLSNKPSLTCRAVHTLRAVKHYQSENYLPTKTVICKSRLFLHTQL